MHDRPLDMESKGNVLAGRRGESGRSGGVSPEIENEVAGDDTHRGSALEVLRVFLKLGVSSFGGPIAHIGYFREEFVVRRRWLSEQAFVDLVALCQFLPGPASSQTGFSIGLIRAGYGGALAAWAGFTLPSAILMVLFAYGAGTLSGPLGAGLLHGLKLVAVAIVAQAVWGMARSLAPDRERASIAALSALIILFSTASVAQVGAIVLGGVLGLGLCRDAPPMSDGHIEIPVRAASVFRRWPLFSFCSSACRSRRSFRVLRTGAV